MIHFEIVEKFFERQFFQYYMEIDVVFIEQKEHISVLLYTTDYDTIIPVVLSITDNFECTISDELIEFTIPLELS